jgi:hypothetical protein
MLCELVATEPFLRRAQTQFFGSRRIADDVFECLGHLSPEGAVLEWAFTDYRARPKAPTVLEDFLKRAAVPVARALLEARMAAQLSIYRVDAAQPGEWIDVEDIFDGTRFLVQEAAMSGCGVEGHYVPMRIMKVGEWHLMGLAGPCLTQLQIVPALEFLEGLGVELSAEGMRKSAQKLGRLWEFVLECMAEPLVVMNADGEEMVFQTATFRVEDAGVVARALDARKDVMAVGDEGQWMWRRKGAGRWGDTDNSVLGQLEMMDDRLVLEVTSAERLEKARKWIETLPGVTFESARARGVLDEDGPVDDALPAKRREVGPEVAREAEEQITKLLWSWLDMPLPALKGKTPREACKTAKGRRWVEVLVRTMPDAEGPGGRVVAPREEMLKELGIGGHNANSGTEE